MSMNWLEGLHQNADEPGHAMAMAMPVFAGQKLVVVGGSSGMGRQTAEDVVAAGGSAVIIGEDPGKVDDTVQACRRTAQRTGSPPTWPTGSRSSGSASNWPASTPTPHC